MHVGREGHLGGVRLFVCQRLHTDDRLSFMGDLDPPVNPVLASRGDLHGLRGRVEQFSTLPSHSSTTCTDLLLFSLLWTLAESTTSSFWTKNRGAWSRTRRSLVVMMSVSPWPTRVPGPRVHALTFQVVRLSGKREFDLGGAIGRRRQRRGPEGRIGEVGPDNGLNRGPAAAGSTVDVGGDHLAGLALGCPVKRSRELGCRGSI